MGQVVTLASPRSIDEAWAQYQSLAIQIADDAHLLADRAFNEQLARAHERWRRLFLMAEAAE